MLLLGLLIAGCSRPAPAPRSAENDANAAFQQGKIPMNLTGSWMFGTFLTGIKDFKWGLFVLPGKKYNTGSGGNLWAVPTNGFVLLTLATMLFMGGIGFRDDFLKITRKQSKGLSARSKLLLQSAWALVVIVVLLTWPTTSQHTKELMVPFFKDPVIRDMGIFFTFIFIALVMVGSTNAVNLTDGLDGLAIGCSNSVAVAYLVMAYVAGHMRFAQYLQVPHIPGSGELAVFCGCLLGAGLGFLWFNCHPAKVFMGDTGSLALGGAIAMVAILIKQELVLIIVGCVFVMEALSVLLQVAYFKVSGGKRIFKKRFRSATRIEKIYSQVRHHPADRAA